MNGLNAYPLDLISKVPNGNPIDRKTMGLWGDSQTCSATVIRDILRGRIATNPDPRGLQLRGAKIAGRLDLENLTTDVHLALTDCLLEDGILAREARMASVRLRGCRLEHPTEPPLDAAGLRCILLDLSRATIIGHDEAEDGGAVLLRGARIDGHLDCTGACLSNDEGPALTADGLEVRLGMFLRGGFTATGVRRRFTATGVGKRRAVLLRGTRIDRHLVCSGASLSNGTGPALVANGLRVTQDVYLDKDVYLEKDVYLDEEFTATGASDKGAVHLSAASIGGSLVCDGAHLCNKSGPALYANRLQVGQAISLRKGFTATSGKPAPSDRDPGDRDLADHDPGAVHLTGAHIGGSLHCEGGNLCNESGSALVADSLQTGRGIYLHKNFTATSSGDYGVAIKLVRAHVGGALFFDKKAPQNTAHPKRRLEVDGLTYAGVPETVSGKDWRKLLRHGTPRYAAQPYQHLAAGYRALGNDQQARETLIAQRDDQLARTDPGLWECLWGRITKYTPRLRL